jgi:hypothetical protein
LKYRLRDQGRRGGGEGVARKHCLEVRLTKGDVIVRINNNPVKNRKDFDTFMIEGLKRNYILYQVKRDDSLFFAPVKLDTLL